MKKKSWLIACITATIMFFTACDSSSTKDKTAQDSTKVKENEKDAKNGPPKIEEDEKIPTDRKFNDVATYLAGLPQPEGGALNDLEENKAWQAYAKKSEETWNKTIDKKIDVMTSWRAKEEPIQEANKAKGLLFYPFSGPDFLNANTFFPEADKYIMIGLEPIGEMPNAQNIDKKAPGYFNNIQISLQDILSLSFFRTNDMKGDFSKIGTLPILFIFMKRTGHDVLYYEKVAVNPRGELVKAKDLEISGKDSSIYGSKIVFRKPNSSKNKTLYYFSTDLSDGALKKRMDFVKFLKNQDITSTYVKSASYLMHKTYFSIIRTIILEKTDYLLQDDSGIPLKYFQDKKWALTFYGSYIKPIGLFSNLYQKDLREVYKDEKRLKDLPFGIGYQYQKGTSNLMFAKRKK